MPIIVFFFIIYLPSKDYDANEDDKDNPTYDRSKVSHPWRKKLGWRIWSFLLRIRFWLLRQKGKNIDRKKDGSYHSPSSQRVYSACSQGSLSDDYIQDVMRSDMI